ncbi:MAG: hypothetical protein NTZ87_00255 [Candidatus Nomurabacteria bacterium]|nr:hypothetical protein [Candidatus Nomurabacteria bacterium]
MDYISKIKKVRENIQEWQKEHGNEFSYMILGFQSENEITDEISTIIDPEEHKEIVQYLARRKFIEITKETPTSCKIKILPKASPIIKLKTLELIARELKDHYTGYEITKMLGECGVGKKLIIPNSKWLIFYRLFEELSISQDKKAKKLLYKIIGESVHPLNLGGNSEMSESLVEKFNEYLKYDDLTITYSDFDKKYSISNSKNLIEIDEEEELNILNQEVWEQEQEELSFLQKPENIEKISTLRKAYQVFMNIVEVYCENPSSPTHELNDVYLDTKKLMTNIVDKLHLHNGVLVKESGDKNYYSKMITLQHFFLPFSNLFIAEAEYEKNKNEKLHWDNIRPKMHASYGSIDELYRRVDGSDILSKPDVQETLNDISLFLSKTKEKNKKQAETKEKEINKSQKLLDTLDNTIIKGFKDMFSNSSNQPREQAIQRIEITAMPDLNIKHIEDNIVVKNNKKRITLPKFPRTEWLKVSITFIGERDILLSNGKDTKPSSFEGLACDDGRTGRPDDNWDFFLKLAKGNGQTLPISKKEREKQKKQKQKITDILRKIFQNDTDPFETEIGGIYKAKFNIKYTADNNIESQKSTKFSDLEEVFSEMTEPSQDIDSEFSQ